MNVIENAGKSSPRDVEIRGLTADSRAVDGGFLFAALPGSRADGRAFIAEAVARGAVAILAPKGTILPPFERPVHLIEDRNPRRRLALMAARFYPRQPETVVAVTGTSGKTSVASFTHQIWTHLGRKAASLGTLGLQPARAGAPKSLTTPDPVELHACLESLAAEGVDCLAMEASSHGLDQYRLDGVRLAAAAFTNLSRDHLDYHPGMDAYLAAKARLFEDILSPDGTAVINADAEQANRLRAMCEARGLAVMTYGTAGGDLRLLDTEPTAEGQRLTVDVLGHRVHADLPVFGTFQALNVLAALALVLSTGTGHEDAAAALGHLKGVPGRMELVGRAQNGAMVFVDYAHKPGALEAVLLALRPHTHGRLHVVVGCGGDRDAGKRPMMGEIATRLADRLIVTDDNPRTEDPAKIRSEMLSAAPGAVEIGDRGEAIASAVAALGPGDVLVIAGKGHESGQIVGTRVHPFDDRDVARAALAACGAVPEGERP